MPDTNSQGVFTAQHILEFPYTRSVGPVIGHFLTGLRDGRLTGVRTRNGRVLVPPSEYDPETAEDVTDEFVDVGPGGSVTTWSWVNQPREKQPLGKPFAWALIKLDGADTALLHVVDGGEESAMSTGMRVTVRWKEQREGMITDIECFEPEAA